VAAEKRCFGGGCKAQGLTLIVQVVGCTARDILIHQQCLFFSLFPGHTSENQTQTSQLPASLTDRRAIRRHAFVFQRCSKVKVNSRGFQGFLACRYLQDGGGMLILQPVFMEAGCLTATHEL